MISLLPSIRPSASPSDCPENFHVPGSVSCPALQRLKVCHLQPDWHFLLFQQVSAFDWSSPAAGCRICVCLGRVAPFLLFFSPFEKICLEWRPLMSCFRTSHHTRIHQSDCLLRSFFSFCSCCEGGKTPRKIARACLCKQRKDFCRNEELALVKSTLVCCTCTDFSPSLRHQSESHAFTSVCHFVWHFPFFFLATTCIRHKLQSRESLAPRLLPIFVVWTVVCLIMFFLKPQPSTSSSPVVFILATFLCEQAK